MRMPWKQKVRLATKGLRGWVLAGDPAEAEVIVGIGTKLESGFEGAPAEAEDLTRLTGKMLELLQALYQEQLRGPRECMRRLAGALETTERYLDETVDEQALCEACQDVCDLLDAGGCDEALPAVEADEPADEAAPGAFELTFDDLAGRLVCMSGDDAAAQQALLDDLSGLMEQKKFPALTMLHARQAALQLRMAIDGTVGGDEVLAQIGADLEQAARATEDSRSGRQAPPSQEASAARASVVSTDTPAEAAVIAAAAILPADTDMELLGEFVTECLDHLAAAEASLLELEGTPDASEPINVIFRAFHTIKGTSGFLGLDPVQRLAHLAESLLDRGREGQIRITGGYADLSLQACDALRSLIEHLRTVEPGSAMHLPSNFEQLLANLSEPEARGFTAETTAAAPMRVGDILVGTGKAEREAVEQVASQEDDRPIGRRLIDSGAARATDVADALRVQKLQAGGDATVRVSTQRLDSLIEMVGELVISHSMIAQDPVVVADGSDRLGRNVGHCGKIVRELQGLTMSLRMVPLKSVFQKMARLVRDLGRKAGKQVRFVTEGEETEIDRNMVESLGDPLVHMMRNACDHGLEGPEGRAAAGKNPIGTVTLRAYHSAGNVVIELRDDGRGLDREKILAKAISKGLLDAARAKDLTDSEVFGMIFQAGFSTAEKITDVSGRGVGMDVVRKNVEHLRGRIEVQSRLGEGSTFIIRLPLTMAITDAMLLRVGSQRYLMPTVSIQQSFRPPAGSVSTVGGRGEMVLLRGELLPVVRLGRLFGIPDGEDDPYAALIVIIEGEGRRCALLVDELLGQQQVVVKALGESFGEIPGVAGGAILGDGRVGLILDAKGLQVLAHGGPRAAVA